MSPQRKHLYLFGPFRFDCEERLLLRDSEPVPLPPKVIETLSVLLENAGHLIGKDELMRRIWPDTFVEEGNLNKSISVLRKTLGQWDGGRDYIETIPKRGYRFVATLNVGNDIDKTPQLGSQSSNKDDGSCGVKPLDEALGDSADTPRFVETLSRGGGRFIATVDGLATPAPTTSRRWRLVFIAMLGLA